MTLWFSASAVGPELADLWGLLAAQIAWLTNAVQLGFVVGALGSAAVTLADVVKPRYRFAVSAAIGWQWAFAPLAIGLAIGVAAIFALRRRPEAAMLAGGRR